MADDAKPREPRTHLLDGQGQRLPSDAPEVTIPYRLDEEARVALHAETGEAGGYKICNFHRLPHKRG